MKKPCYLLQQFSWSEISSVTLALSSGPLLTSLLAAMSLNSPTYGSLQPIMLSVKVMVTQSCLTLCNPKDYTFHGILQARILEWVAISFTRGSSQPRDRTKSPTLQVDSLPAEPPGKPKNTGAGGLSLLQGIFLTQELNWGLLHCRQILYQLS